VSFFRIPSPTPQEGGAERAKKGRTTTQLFSNSFLLLPFKISFATQPHLEYELNKNDKH
jgi:hypothetical protein